MAEHGLTRELSSYLLEISPCLLTLTGLLHTQPKDCSGTMASVCASSSAVAAVAISSSRQEDPSNLKLQQNMWWFFKFFCCLSIPFALLLLLLFSLYYFFKSRKDLHQNYCVYYLLITKEITWAFAFLFPDEMKKKRKSSSLLVDATHCRAENWRKDEMGYFLS